MAHLGRVCRASYVLCLIGILSACGKSAPPAAQAPPPEVVVQTVTQRSTTLPLEIVAEVKALSEVEIRPRASGLLLKLMFQPGQRVKEGQPLASIDSRPYDEAVLDAQLGAIEPLQSDEQIIARPCWPQPPAPGHPITTH